MESRFNTFNNYRPSEQEHCLLSYWDSNLVCRFANNEFIPWYGLKPAEIIGMKTLKSLFGSSYHLHAPYIEKLLAGKSQIHEYDMEMPSGEVTRVVATYYPDIDQGKVSGFFMHISVIDETAFNADQSGEGENESSRPASSQKMKLVAKFLGTQLFSGFPTIEELAQRHHISVSKLMRDFKVEFNSSPFSYYRKLQMEYAAKYMKQTGCTKKEISMILGFSNPANFTTCYNKWIKEEVKSTPAQDASSDHLWIRQLPAAVATLDSEMNYIVVSEAWKALFNSIGIKTASKDVLSLFDHSEHSKWFELYKSILKGKEVIIHEEGMLLSNGTKPHYNWNIRPWKDAKGKVGGAIIYIVCGAKTSVEHQQQYFECLQV